MNNPFLLSFLEWIETLCLECSELSCYDKENDNHRGLVILIYMGTVH